MRSRLHVISFPSTEVATRRQPGTCALTFDDGRLSVAAVVHPVLRAHKLPYTVFVCTDVVMGGPVPWFVRIYHVAATIGITSLFTPNGVSAMDEADRFELTVALKEYPFDRILSGLARLEAAHGAAPPAPESLFMTSAQVSELAAEGVSFGSHTQRRNPILSGLSIEEQRHNRGESGRDRGAHGVSPVAFCIPEREPPRLRRHDGLHTSFNRLHVWLHDNPASPVAERRSPSHFRALELTRVIRHFAERSSSWPHGYPEITRESGRFAPG